MFSLLVVTSSVGTHNRHITPDDSVGAYHRHITPELSEVPFERDNSTHSPVQVVDQDDGMMCIMLCVYIY